MDSINIKLSQPQLEALNSDKKITLFIGGLGCGKNYLLGLWIWNRILTLISLRKQAGINQYFLGLITAPVTDTLNFFTLPSTKDVWSLMGLREGVHYSINEKPPKEWGMSELSGLRNTRIISFIFGGYIIITSTDNFSKLRGSEFDFIASDELRDQAPESFEVILPRLRGKLSKLLGIESSYLGITTQPDNPDMFDFLTNNIDLNVKLVESITDDNKDNLPEGYTAYLKSILPPLIFEREVLGAKVRIGNFACWNFGEDNIINYEQDKHRNLYVIYDFDVSPQVAIILQDSGFTDKGRETFTAFREFTLRPGNTEKLTTIIIDYLKAECYTGNIYLGGDYSGGNRSTKSNRTEWEIIENKFKDAFPGRVSVRKNPTKSVRNNMVSLNSLFKDGEGETRLFVDKSIEYLIKDCKDTVFGNDGRLKHTPDNERTHGVACLGDFAKVWNPITQVTKGRIG